MYTTDHSPSTNDSNYSSQLAAEKAGGLYIMVLMACARARELKKHTSADTARSLITAAIADVENGKVGKEYLIKHQKDATPQYRKHK
jgi:hypothetical protein